jgi:hypothetical protein
MAVQLGDLIAENEVVDALGSGDLEDRVAEQDPNEVGAGDWSLARTSGRAR